MVESGIAERIAAGRAELDELEDQLAKQLEEVRAERDELAVAERVWHRMAEQLAAEKAVVPPTTQVAGRAVLLVPPWTRTRCRRSTSASSPSCATRAGRSSRSARFGGCMWRCGDLVIVTGFKATRARKLTPGQKQANRVLAAGRAPVEYGFANLKAWRVLTKLRTDPGRATALLRALLVLTNFEVNR
ncbi:transposase family protein [Streptomyces sp. ISL-1]|uniref:transposase family protein n=1 Tax=Streptomyces sp. ISL-1 TaxID=2817657 RepID=UPI002034FDDF|nr:transposase family protein [Streptomyces sp. ISL-1]